MQHQNFRNHTRYVPLYHFVTSLLLLATFIGSLINVFTSSRENLYSATLICSLTLIAIFLWVFTRTFALKVQDRAIRAEENLRFFSLTGKLLDKKITIDQIIALRFAEDEEFIDLVQQTIREGLSPKQIKMQIRNWKADHHRA